MILGQQATRETVLLNDGIVLSCKTILSHLIYPENFLAHHFLENA